MSEFYKMEPCFESCGDNDKPYVKGLYNDDLMLTKKIAIEHHHYPSFEAAFSDQWQIKRADPVVLSAEEIVIGAILNCSHHIEGDRTTLPSNQLRFIAEKCIENGQILEWQRNEQVEFRHRVKDLLIHYPNDYYDLKRALKNLKPPYEKEDE